MQSTPASEKRIKISPFGDVRRSMFHRNWLLDKIMQECRHDPTLDRVGNTWDKTRFRSARVIEIRRYAPISTFTNEEERSGGIIKSFPRYTLQKWRKIPVCTWNRILGKFGNVGRLFEDGGHRKMKIARERDLGKLFDFFKSCKIIFGSSREF